MVPGSGIWYRNRSPQGVWQADATRIDTNGNVTAVNAVGLPDGTLHSVTLLPSYGIYDHILGTGGTWDTAQRYDTNGNVTEISATAGSDGIVHLDDTITGQFIDHRTRSTTGAWDVNATVIPTPAHPTDLVTANATHLMASEHLAAGARPSNGQKTARRWWSVPLIVVKSPPASRVAVAALTLRTRTPTTPLPCGAHGLRAPAAVTAASFRRGSAPSVQAPCVPLRVVRQALSKWPPM